MIKSIMNKFSIEKCIFLCIMLLLIAFPIMMIYRYVCISCNLYNVWQPNRVYLLWLVSAFMFTLYALNLIFQKKKITYIDILVYILIILGVLSTIFAIDVNKSIYGEYSRNEGLLSLLAYYFIFLNMKNMSNKKYQKIIMRTIIGLGIVHMIYGILQVYTTLPFIKHFRKPYMASSLSGNPNFFGSYMVMLSSYVFSMYMLERKKIYLFLSLLFFMGICLASSTGPFISFILMIIFFVIYYRKKIKWKSLLIILPLFVLVYFSTDYSIKYLHTKVYKNELNPQYNISEDLKNLNFKDSGNGRLRIWKDSLPFVKKYWLIGAGLDNFGNVYGVREHVYYDKAHNVYLQIAVTNGIFALIAYMAIIFVIFFKGLKVKETMYISMLMAFIGYCIQAFANISVIDVAPTFFVICGLLLGNTKEIPRKSETGEVLSA